MAVGLSGIFSGIDTDLLIAHTIASNSRTLINLTDRRVQYKAEDAALTDFEARLRTLKSAVDSLRDSSELRGVTAKSSDTDVAYAYISNPRGEGVYTFEVNQLANAEMEVHTAGMSSLETILGPIRSKALTVDGVSNADEETWFTTTVNGATYTFDFGTEADITDVVFATETAYTLNEVVDLINVQSQAVAEYDAASVEEVDGQYFLRLKAEELGAVGLLTVTKTVGDDIDEIHDPATDWTRTDGQAGSDFVYTYGTSDPVTRTIELIEDATLSTLVDQINNDHNNPGVTASILQNEAGETDSYHLVLTGTDSGGDYTIDINDTGTTLTGFAEADWTPAQTARDCQLRINGYPSATWIERSSNTITDAIPGGTLYLTGPGTVSITLNRSTSQLVEDLTNLAAIITGLEMTVDRYTGYDQDTDVSGILQGDYFLTGLYNQIVASITQPALGFTDGVETYTLPAHIGLEVSNELGEIAFDSSTFTDAINEDYLGVLELIGGRASGRTSSTDVEFTSADPTTTGGVYDLQIDFDGGGNITEARIKLHSEEEYRTLTVTDGDTLSGTYGDPEQYLILTVVQFGTSETTDYEVRVKQGFAGTIYDRLDDMLDLVSGTMTLKRDSYANDTGTGLIDRLDDRIENEEDRLMDMEEWLVAKYARLEATLAMLDAQRGAFDALITSLDTLNNRD